MIATRRPPPRVCARCSKRLTPAEQWSLLWRHRHALWRPRRLASGKGVDQKGAQPQATEVVSSVKPEACKVIEGAAGGWGI